MTAGGRQIRLGRRPARPRQRLGDREPEMAPQLACLVEPAGAFTRSVQRHGHDEIGAGQYLGASRPHPRRQVPRERRTPVVFQRMDDGPQGALVRPDGARQRHERLPPPAARAPRVRDAEDPPRG